MIIRHNPTKDNVETIMDVATIEPPHPNLDDPLGVGVIGSTGVGVEGTDGSTGVGDTVGLIGGNGVGVEGTDGVGSTEVGVGVGVGI